MKPCLAPSHVRTAGFDLAWAQCWASDPAKEQDRILKSKHDPSPVRTSNLTWLGLEISRSSPSQVPVQKCSISSTCRMLKAGAFVWHFACSTSSVREWRGVDQLNLTYGLRHAKKFLMAWVCKSQKKDALPQFFWYDTGFPNFFWGIENLALIFCLGGGVCGIGGL